MKKDKGITLVALVVMIIVMLILATITYQITIGQNGIITRAQQIKENEALAEAEGQQKINSVSSLQDSSQGVLNNTDTLAPTINSFYASEITTTSFIINVNVTETGSGINKIEYMIGNGQYQEDPVNSKATSFKFSGLSQGTNYTVKVKVTDNVGTYTEVTKDITTNS